MFRALNWIMAALFMAAVVVQYNDPDPLCWMAIYGVAFAVSVAVGVTGRPPRIIAGCVAVLAGLWGVLTALGVSTLATYAHMFDAWEMRSQPIEEARETVGLFIVAVWMSVLALLRGRSTHAAPRGRP